MSTDRTSPDDASSTRDLDSAPVAEEALLEGEDERNASWASTSRDLGIVTLVGLPLQLIATDMSLPQALVGLFALGVVCVVGVALTKWVPFYLPSVAWISLLGIALTLPFLPWGPAFTGLVADIDFLALAVPALAYAGLAVTRLEIEVMRRSGVKLAVVAVFVFIGTYIGSAAIAQLMLAAS